MAVSLFGTSSGEGFKGHRQKMDQLVKGKSSDSMSFGGSAKRLK